MCENIVNRLKELTQRMKQLALQVMLVVLCIKANVIVTVMFKQGWKINFESTHLKTHSPGLFFTRPWPKVSPLPPSSPPHCEHAVAMAGQLAIVARSIVYFAVQLISWR